MADEVLRSVELPNRPETEAELAMRLELDDILPPVEPIIVEDAL